MKGTSRPNHRRHCVDSVVCVFSRSTLNSLKIGVCVAVEGPEKRGKIVLRKYKPGNKRDKKEDGVSEKYELRLFKRVCILIFGARPLDDKKTFLGT